MILKNNYYYFKQAVPLKTCKKILKAGREKIKKEATTFKGVNKVKRDCMIAWINDTWIYDILNPFIHTANKEAGWNFQWIGTNLHNLLFMKKVIIMGGTPIKVRVV